MIKKLTNFIQTYIKLHLNLLEIYYKSIIFRVKSKKLFVILYNLRNRMKNVETRFLYEKQSLLYVVYSTLKNERRRLHFCSRHQAFGNYAKGIKERGDNLGQTYLLNNISFNNGDKILDCGANVGDLLLWFQNNDINVEYEAFEPSPKEFECLTKNIYPHKAHNVALWFEENEIEFFVSSQRADSSLIKPKIYDKLPKLKQRSYAITSTDQ